MHIGRVTMANGQLVTRVVLDGQIQPAAIARLVNLMHQGAPLYAQVYSPQGAMDLDLVTVVEVRAEEVEG